MNKEILYRYVVGTSEKEFDHLKHIVPKLECIHVPNLKIIKFKKCTHVSLQIGVQH